MSFKPEAEKEVRPASERVEHYIKAREERVAQNKYEFKLGLVTPERLEKPFADLEKIDKAVGEILTEHGIYARRRTAYLSFARELYAFLRRYKGLKPEYVAAKISEYVFMEECRREILIEIAEKVFGVGRQEITAGAITF